MMHSRSQQISELRKYLAQNKIPKKLAVRIHRNALQSHAARERMTPEADVQLLSCISIPLRSELRFELYRPIISVHPFLAAFTEQCPQVMRRVCGSAVFFQIVHHGDEIFQCADPRSTTNVLCLQWHLPLPFPCRHYFNCWCWRVAF